MSAEPAARRSKPTTPLQHRELELRRDIAEAYFNAQSPVEVYRLALARVTPLIAATFSSVFLRDPGDSELLRLVCAHNWPQASARFLSQLRIRVGRGPTGRAVADRQPVEVLDLFTDITLRDWWEPARELRFSSLISLPLGSGDECYGALTFYYDHPHEFNDEERGLLSLIAQQLSITAQRAEKVERLRLENLALREQAKSLSARVGESEEMQRLKTEFVSNISHELRTPLTSILGYSYLLLEGQQGALTEAQSKTMRKIDASANVLLQMINDLLALTDIKLGRTEVNAMPDDAVLIAHRAAEKADTNGPVRFAVESAEDRVPIQTDVDKVLRILENLLSNAFKFTREGEIVLSVRRIGFGEQQRVEWTVRDTGIGIPRSELPKIFDEFHQVDGSSTRLYGGTGLGLSLSLQLTRLLGGELMVESEPGRGSVFIVRLPVIFPGQPRLAF